MLKIIGSVAFAAGLHLWLEKIKAKKQGRKDMIKGIPVAPTWLIVTLCTLGTILIFICVMAQSEEPKRIVEEPVALESEETEQVEDEIVYKEKLIRQIKAYMQQSKEPFTE